MDYIFYPNKERHIHQFELAEDEQDTYIAYKDEGGYVGKDIHDLAKDRKRAWLYLKVVTFLDKLAEVENTQSYFDRQLLYNLGDGLYEMRIPKTDGRGVYRIYYCDSQERNTFELLAAEFKDGNKKPKLEGLARTRMAEYQEACKRKGKPK